MKAGIVLAIFGTLTGGGFCHGAENDKKMALAFINEYVDELSTFDQIRVSAPKEAEKDSVNERLLDGINTCEKFQLELKAAIENLKAFQFSKPFDQLTTEITDVYQMKIGLWKQLGEITSQFVLPKDGLDYGTLAADIPKLRARLEYLDKSLFDACPTIFFTLMDLTQKDDTKPAHLSITKAERQELLNKLRNDFGAKLDMKGQNYEVTTASLLKHFLLVKKCADEVTYK